MRLDLLALIAVTFGSMAVPSPALAPARATTGKKTVRPVRVLDGVSFDAQRKDLFVPISELREIARLPLEERDGAVWLGARRISSRHTRSLFDGTRLVSVRGLKAAGASVWWDKRRGAPVVAYRSADFPIRRGVQRVVVNRAEQRLRGYQGGRLVIETIVSTGRSGFTTPRGQFTAGPFKAEMHHSRLYNDAPMPYCVQVIGNVCIHGSASVPRYPASHGCVRVPLTGSNPARFIYNWIDRGTPVMIRDAWTARAASS
jgi:hypothetical protein